MVLSQSVRIHLANILLNIALIKAIGQDIFRNFGDEEWPKYLSDVLNPFRLNPSRIS